MNRLALAACFAIFAAAFAAPAAANGTFIQADAKALAIKIIAQPESYAGPMHDAYTVLDAKARCSTTKPRAIDVTLTWDVKHPEAKAFRIDITEFEDGFAKGRYLTSGEVTTSVRQVVFEEAAGGGYYYWRVLTSTAAGWVVSGAGRFDAPVCAVDMKESE